MNNKSHTTEPVVTCPECGHRFPLSKALVGPIEAQVAQRLEAKYELRERQRDDEAQRRIAEATARAAQKAKAEQATETTTLRQEVTEQREAIARLQAQELEQRKRTRELEGREKALTLEVERQVDARSKAVEEETAKRMLEQHRLKDAEKEKLIADLRRQLEEAMVKVQQGSQQMQGEVAELDLEQQLRQAFPKDEIEPVAKGQRGADVLQRVIDLRGQVCGTIIWERKNARNFSDTWVPKLREDQRASRAEVAVIVTTALPKDIVALGQHLGVWVTSPSTSVALALALRSQLLEVARARIVAEGQAEKQTTLLAYLSGTEFKQRVEAVLDPLIAMVEDFEKERRISETNWARRQKRHEQLMRGITGLWGDVSGIIGTLPAPKQLQLAAGEEGGKEAA
jgi:hypothetical protein